MNILILMRVLQSDERDKREYFIPIFDNLIGKYIVLYIYL